VTTVQLRPETREALKAIGGKGQTYDEIIWDLIAAYETRLEEIERRLKDSKEMYITHGQLKKKWGIK